MAISLFFIPAIIIQPFKHQTAFGLALAMALRHRAPWGTLLAVLASSLLCCAIHLERRPIAGGKGCLVVGGRGIRSHSPPSCARLNYFEWMFHPVDSARFETEAASKLDKRRDDSGGPLRLRCARLSRSVQMAYHHVLNDVVNGVPIAVTY